MKLRLNSRGGAAAAQKRENRFEESAWDPSSAVHVKASSLVSYTEKRTRSDNDVKGNSPNVPTNKNAEKEVTFGNNIPRDKSDPEMTRLLMTITRNNNNPHIFTFCLWQTKH